MTEVDGITLRRHEAIDGKSLLYHLVALSVMLVTISIVYFGTFQSMVGLWISSDTFLHGFIILPLSVYLIWQKWPQLRSIPPQSFVPGIFVFFAISAVWLVADILGIQVAKQFAATAAIPAACLTVMGVSFSRAIAFPLVYLFFSVPFGEFWVPELMEITADFAVGLLRIVGIPVLRDGLFLNIPAGNFEVAKACSGIRYILAMLALGTIYGYLNYHRMYKMLIFIAFSLVLPIIANGFRAFGIVAIAHYSDMKYAVGVDHIIYGWIFFGVVICVMFLVGNRYRDDVPEPESVSSGKSDIRPIQPTKLGVVVLVAILATLIGPFAGQAIATNKSQESGILNGLPTLVAGWQGKILPDPEWVPTFAGATQNLLVRYLGSAGQIDAALVRYIGSQQDGELANATNSVIGSNGWQRRSTNERIVDVGESQSIVVTEHLTLRNGRVRRIWYWYEVDGNIVRSNLEIKLNEALSLLSGRPTISSAIMVSTIEGDDAPDVLQAFLNDTYNAISECLASTVPKTTCRLGLTDMEIN